MFLLRIIGSSLNHARLTRLLMVLVHAARYLLHMDKRNPERSARTVHYLISSPPPPQTASLIPRSHHDTQRISEKSVRSATQRGMHDMGLVHCQPYYLSTVPKSTRQISWPKISRTYKMLRGILRYCAEGAIRL